MHSGPDSHNWSRKKKNKMAPTRTNYPRKNNNNKNMHSDTLRRFIYVHSLSYFLPLFSSSSLSLSLYPSLPLAHCFVCIVLFAVFMLCRPRPLHVTEHCDSIKFAFNSANRARQQRSKEYGHTVRGFAVRRVRSASIPLNSKKLD